MEVCPAQENQTQSSCSHLFEDIHPAFTIIQACAAVIFVLIAAPLNLILTVAIVKFHHQMDEGFILSIGIFVTNVVMILSNGINIFLSSVTRSWPLGYAGCQILAFLSFYPITVRWVTLGMLSIDRFCRVFLPFFYDRHSKIVLAVLLVIPWIVVLPFNILSFVRVFTKFEFSILFPACYRQFHCDGSVACLVFTLINLVVVLSSGSILPIAVYTVLYIKSRRLLRSTQIPHVSDEQQIAYTERQKKATKTFALMVVVFSCYSASGVFLRSLQVIPTIQNTNGLQFFIYDFILTYTITDFLIVWKNTDGKKVIKKLINIILRRQVFNTRTIPPVPAPASHRECMTTASSGLVADSGQQQLGIGKLTSGQMQPVESTSTPMSGTNQNQPDIISPDPVLTSGQEPLALISPDPVVVSGQEWPVPSPSGPVQPDTAVQPRIIACNEEQVETSNPAPLPAPIQDQSAHSSHEQEEASTSF